MYVCVFLLPPQTSKFNTHQWSTILQGGWGGVGCWWQLDIRRKGKEGVFFRTTAVGKSMCQMRIVCPSFYLVSANS